jgi:pimeloyl-ACP methyl ester carboxylesterase
MRSFFLRAAFIIAVSAAGVAVLTFFAITPDIDRATLEARYAGPLSQFSDLDSGARIHYRDEGKSDGPALVLIHGSNASLNTWEPWVALLGDTYRLISMDLPGHGLTGSMANSRYTITEMSDFVVALMDRLGVEHAYLAGNSMGGAVSLQLALDYPSRVDGLILISAAGMRRDVDDPPVGAFRFTQTAIGRAALEYVTPRFMIKRSIEKIVADPAGFVTDAMVTRYWELLRMTGSREASAIRFAGYAQQAPLEPRLGEITAPSLILWGIKDSLIKPKYGTRMHDALQNSELVIYDNAGHLAMEEIPETTAQAARQFIEANRR